MQMFPELNPSRTIYYRYTYIHMYIYRNTNAILLNIYIVYIL